MRAFYTQWIQGSKELLNLLSTATRSQHSCPIKYSQKGGREGMKMTAFVAPYYSSPILRLVTSSRHHCLSSSSSSSLFLAGRGNRWEYRGYSWNAATGSQDDDDGNVGHDDDRKIVRFAMTTASAGLLLLLWLKTKWGVVEAAKPINDYQDLKYRTDLPRRESSAERPIVKLIQSNREKFNFIADIVDKVKDTVVSIETKDHTRVDVFTGTPITASNGSGFIVSEDGLILTNAHVVPNRPKTSFSVRLADGRTFAATVEDIDLESDLATIRINSKNLPVLPLGSSSEARLGEWVVAVGCPLTLSNSVTSGVISSTSRGASEIGLKNEINYIQTDASITFGNSGGPLINLDGEAIGINSMTITVAAGISFAIPIDHAKKFLAKAEARRLSGKKRPSRRYMGISVLSVTDQIKLELESRGYKKVSQGVLVWQVVVGSPAYLAGVKPGDIIVRINANDIRSSHDLYEVTNTADKLTLQVQRGDKLYHCTVTPEIVMDD